MSDNPIKFPRSPSSSEDDLPTHHSSEEDISSDEWMSSDHIPLWSSKKEDPEEEDEDDANTDAEDDDDSDDDSNDSNSDSNFALPPLIYLD
jgi:hypothetical protein